MCLHKAATQVQPGKHVQKNSSLPEAVSKEALI